MTKRSVVQLRCSEEEKARWEGEAVRIGVSLSELARFSMNAFWGDIEQVKAGLRWDASRPGSGFQVPAPEVVAEDAVERVQSGGLPSAAQVAKRPFKSDFK